LAWNQHRQQISAASAINRQPTTPTTTTLSTEASSWGLLALEDPGRTAIEARVLWHPRVCRLVLPVHGVVASTPHRPLTLDLSGVRCDALLVLGFAGEQHVLFSDDTRRLQLIVTAADLRDHPPLLTDAILTAANLEIRFQLLRRLSHLAAHGELPPRLFPQEPGADRLRLLLQVLDGDLDGATQRDIAIALFGVPRVKADWAARNGNLRDRVRRAIRRARWLMDGGYLHLLK
jgi:hypothetical protein